MALLKKKDILAKPDYKSEIVPVPEWGGDVRVRSLSSEEKDHYDSTVWETKFQDGKPTTVPNFLNQRARLVVKCLIDEDGSRLFGDGEAEVLGHKNAEVIDRLFKKIQDLSGISDKSKAVIEKNSEPAPV